MRIQILEGRGGEKGYIWSIRQSVDRMQKQRNYLMVSLARWYYLGQHKYVLSIMCNRVQWSVTRGGWQAACHHDRSVSRMAVNCIHETVTYILASFNEPPHFQFSEALCKPFETLLSLQLCDADVQDQVSYRSVAPRLSVFHPPRSRLFSDRVFHLRAGRGVLLPDPVCSQIVCSICALVEASSSQILSVLRSYVPSACWSRRPPPRSCLFSDRVFHLRAGRGVLLPDPVCSQIVCSICALVEASSSQILSVLRSYVPSACWSRRPPPRSCLFSDRVFHLRAGRGVLLPDPVCSQIVCSICVLVEASSSQILSVLRSCVPSARWSRRPPPRSSLFSDRVFHLRAGRGVLLPDPVCSQIVCSICALVEASSQILSVLRSCVPSARWSRHPPPRSSLFSDRVFHLRAGRGVLLPDPVCSQIVCSICALVEASSQILSVLRSCVPSARWSRHPPPRSCLFSDRVFHLRAGRGVLLPDPVCSQIVCSICALVEASSSQILSVLRSCVPSARWSRRPPPRSCLFSDRVFHLRAGRGVLLPDPVCSQIVCSICALVEASSSQILSVLRSCVPSARWSRRPPPRSCLFSDRVFHLRAGRGVLLPDPVRVASALRGAACRPSVVRRRRDSQRRASAPRRRRPRRLWRVPRRASRPRLRERCRRLHPLSAEVRPWPGYVIRLSRSDTSQRSSEPQNDLFQ